MAIPVKSRFPAGHFSSPVVDPSTVEDYVKHSSNLNLDELFGISVDIDEFHRFWRESLEVMRCANLTETGPGGHRYHQGGPYPAGDALFLRAMIARSHPNRIIEIGSGFSTACMLDAADDLVLPKLLLTCIEPFPKRLRSLMRDVDYERVTIIEEPVQQVPLDLFDTLDRNDVLFIDSTHVLKTGSDVHYELFEILPRLKSGVLIHFHDCRYPFEYPHRFIFEQNHSWNEAYALRAFLMFNSQFKIVFWGSCLKRFCHDAMRADFPQFPANAGSAIWIVRL